jgi:hypothetical protein
VTGSSPRNCSADVAFRLYTFFRSGVERARHAVFLNPGPQHPPAGAQIVSPLPRRACVSHIIHHVHQAPPWSTLFEPGVETPFHLYQFLEVGFALPSLAVFSPPQLPAPKHFLQRTVL